MAVAIDRDLATCFHCGLDVPRGVRLETEVLGATRPMCCVGCLAVAETLVAAGLERWYETREAPTGRPAELVPDVLAEADFLRVQDVDAEFATHARGDALEASLLVEGVSCAVCAWVIERHLEALPGVRDVRMSSLSNRLRIRWAEDGCSLAAIVERLAGIGFVARPDEPDAALDLARRERRGALVRIGIAALATMNVMTYAVALYMSDAPGVGGGAEAMSQSTRDLLRGLCFLVATPVVCVSAMPFFRAAIRDLRVGRPGMDVPVALAIGGAFLASAWAVISGSGSVYFESVCMFTLFLSLGRFVEMDIRHRSAARSRALLDATPDLARRIEDGRERIVSARAVAAGDRLRIREGDVVPVDARVLSGAGGVEEAVLTGEPWPRRVGPGDTVRAGSLADAPLEVEALTSAGDSTLAALVELIDRAQADKPPIARRADRVASWFVLAVLGVSAATAAAWAVIDVDRAFWVTLSVLVATCPCALGLATPAALAAATEGLARRGFVITRAHVLEALARVDRFVFDKTGTLTEGRPRLRHVVALRDETVDEVVEHATVLESGSGHVLARAFDDGSRVVAAVDAAHVAGQGVEGKLGTRRLRLGHPEWVTALAGASETVPSPPDDRRAGTWILLGDESGPLAWFGLDDPVRDGAAASLAALRSEGIAVEMLSGDPSAGAGALAGDLGLERRAGAVRPEQKLEHVRRLVDAGQRVAFVGDGLNDGPVMRAAPLSIAMGGGCDRTRLGADALLWNDDLACLPTAVAWARRAQRVIRQNFVWAIGYNVCVLPLAVSGRLPPWLAALGMSLSSLVVVANSARLRRAGETA